MTGGCVRISTLSFVLHYERAKRALPTHSHTEASSSADSVPGIALSPQNIKPKVKPFLLSENLEGCRGGHQVCKKETK